MFPFNITKKVTIAKQESTKTKTTSLTDRDANDSCKVQVVKGRDMHQDFLSLVDHFCHIDDFEDPNESHRVKRPRLALIEERIPICKFTGTGFYSEHHVSTRHHFAVKRTEMRAYFRLLGKHINAHYGSTFCMRFKCISIFPTPSPSSYPPLPLKNPINLKLRNCCSYRYIKY